MDICAKGAAMADYDDKLADALQVARMYYYQNLNTEAIAQELDFSRSKVSRLLTYAKEQGLVEVRIIDPQEQSQRLERRLQERYSVPVVNVVKVPESANERDWLEQVAAFTAHTLNTLLTPHMILGLAWGTTLSTISRHLIPKPISNLNVVQLNGAGNTQSLGIAYASEIVMRFAENYQAKAHLFPVPTFFDFAETKRALWRERSIRRILELQERADILLYSIGAVQAGVPSHVYSGGYLESRDYAELEEQGVVGDIATVFFRADGSYADVPMNTRTSGPDLALLRQVQHSICIVSGKGKARGLQAALRGGFVKHLIVDEPTARIVLEMPDAGE
jgi:DNA-binding transcriptional regulator LsrR (DeoR family)